MTPLDRFRERIEPLEHGQRPVDADVCRKLIDEMRLHPWQTAAERDKAQGVGRPTGAADTRQGTAQRWE